MSDISRTCQAVRTATFDEALAEHLAVNPTDLRCLELAMAEPGLTPSRLAAASGLTTGAVTGVLDRLEKAGFVTRKPDPADRRSVTVHPAASRTRDLDLAVAPLERAIGDLLARHPPGERDAIASFLERASQAVDEATARLRATTRGGFVDDTFRAPLAGATRGRLEFASGAPRLAFNIAPLGPQASARIIMETSASRLEFCGIAADDDLVEATFDGPRPDVRTSDGLVTIRYRRQPIAAFTARKARIALSASVPWTIELAGGISNLTGSLDGVVLERLDVAGGANHVQLELPRPHGTASVRLNGVASSAAFRRPEGVPVAVRVAGGISHLRVDGRRTGQVSGKRRYVGDGFDTSPDRYELEILGGASDVSVTTR